MPRPNPPRKRPRKRPAGNPNAARADAALTKQTAQSTQPKNAVTPQRASGGGGATATAAPQPDEMWAKRSYAILIGLIAVIELPISAIQWAFQPAISNGIPKGEVYQRLVGLDPISLLVASLFAAPVAKMLAAERRSLRFMETIFVAIVTYFVWLVLVVAASTFLTAGTRSGSSNGGPGATPCASGAACTTSPPPQASASSPASSQPSASAGASQTPAPGTATNPTGLLASTPAVYAIFITIDILSYVATFYFYPPLYKRMRPRPRPPRTPAPRGGGGGKKQ